MPSRALRSLGCVVLFALVACHGGKGASHPGAPLAYPATRWIPGDATYAVTARRSRDAAIVLRDLVAVVGMIGDFDERDASRGAMKELGFDPFDPTTFGAVGVDPDGGLAVFSQGLSPTFAIALTDPATTTAAIDRLRQGGIAVQVGREQGVEVYTFAGDREVHVHWAIADKWLFVHIEIRPEHEAELAWFRALRAADGAWAGSPDLAASLAAARTGGPDAPTVIGAVRLPAVLAKMVALGAPRGCADQLGAVGRIFVAARSDARDARGSIAVELAGGIPADATFAAPAGWATARDQAPLQAEWGIDLDRVVPRLLACDAGLGRELARLPVKAGRAYVHSLDLDDLDGRGAAWVATREPRMVADMLDEIPARSLAEHKRTAHGVPVVDVSVPMLPKFSYVLGQGTFLGAAGGGEIDRVIGDGTTQPAALARIAVAPQAWPVELWDELFKAAGLSREGARGRTIARLRRWTLGEIELSTTATGVILTAHGARK
ncbi:MAG: hypothetical protein K8W52_11520 [Deltaproteobacteria bacterium]|nr:hypothetical protein [Deltaproteobacteria bacterium]